MGNCASIQDYEEIEIIGRGSFGEVHKIKNKKTNKIYAMKILHQDHPCILPFIGANYFSFNDEQRPAIIFKYAANGSLDRILEFGRQYERVPFWDNTMKLCCIYGIALGMSYLHKNNIIHYDLKPSNILLDEYLFPLITDFGISQILDNKKKNLPATTLNGTIYYTAPEIWGKQKITYACDVYSFAFVLYSILTNEEPYMNYNQYEFFMNVIHNGERPEMNSKIPPPFQSLIQRCWSQNPSERPTFDEIVDEISGKKEYLLNDVDSSKFYKYVELMSQNKTELIEKEFEKIDIKKELKKDPVFDQAYETLFKECISKLNELPKSKKGTIINTIYKNESKVNFYKIKINSNEIKALYEDKTLNSDHFINILRFFRKISIHLQFPSQNFESIMKILMMIKDSKMNKLKIILNVSGVNAIGEEFKNNSAISKVKINPPLTSIKEDAFRGCISLKLVKFPNGLLSIESSIFRMCENLK